MSLETLSPTSCTTMGEVRQGIDALDRQIVGLLGERFRYIEAAARIKQRADTIRDEPRINEVLDNVARAASQNGVPVDLARELYRLLVESSVTYEMEKFSAKSDSV